MYLNDDWRVQLLDDEPYCCDETNEPNEVLYAGSDDERYDNPEEKRLRYENAALRFLAGHAPVLLTTTLRGPFEGPEAKGWVNPWRSKKITAPAPLVPEVAASSRLLDVDVLDTGSTTSCHLPSPQSLDQAGIPPHPYMDERELERVEAWRSATESAIDLGEEPTWSLSTDLSQSQSGRKRRSTGSDWLKRKDTKRRRAEDMEEVEGASMVAQHDTPSHHRGPSQSQSRQETQSSIADVTSQSWQSPTARSRLSRRTSQRVSNRSSQRHSSQIPSKPISIAEDQNPAPLSTPIQTPQSSRKLKVTPRMSAKRELVPRQTEVAMSMAESRDGAEIKVELETQEDESFLFRARPRSRAPETAADISGCGPISSPLSRAPVESDSDDEAIDLDGDTCMADDTKATSPEPCLENECEDKCEDIVVLEDDEDEPVSKPSPPQLPADNASDKNGSTETAEPTEHEDRQDTTNDQHNEEDTGAEAEAVSASQERTLVALPASQEEQKESQEPTGRTSSAVLGQDDSPAASQPESRRETLRSAQKVLSQSPWSKADHFIASSPCPAGQQRQEQMETSTVQESALQAMPTTESREGVGKSRMSLDVETNSQQHQESSSPATCNRNEIVDQYESPAIPASQQSPWKTDAPTVTAPQQLQVIHEGDGDSVMDPSCQSSWAATPEKMRQVAQEVLMSKLFSKQALSPAPPLPLISSTPMQPDTPAAGSAVEVSSTRAAETPKTASSPEPVISIKSFANFMSPSPERPRRRPNKVRLSGGHLPSTQNLLAATTDNPWDSTQKPVKRVAWAPLPHEADDNENPEGKAPHTPTVPRTASPPPEFAVADLPTGDDDQFQKHFQAVSRRTKLHHRILPSASQQFLDSPGPMAMADAFVTADSFKARTPVVPEAPMVVSDTPLATKGDSQEDPLDDVDDVLRNLNEFIEMVDVETDLARTKEEERKKAEKREQQRAQGTTSTGIGGFSFDEVLDAGVWG